MLPSNKGEIKMDGWMDANSYKMSPQVIIDIHDIENILMDFLKKKLINKQVRETNL